MPEANLPPQNLQRLLRTHTWWLSETTLTTIPGLLFYLFISRGQTQCRRLPHEWGLGKGKTEASLRTHDLVTQWDSSHHCTRPALLPVYIKNGYKNIAIETIVLVRFAIFSSYIYVALLLLLIFQLISIYLLKYSHGYLRHECLGCDRQNKYPVFHFSYLFFQFLISEVINLLTHNNAWSYFISLWICASFISWFNF